MIRPLTIALAIALAAAPASSGAAESSTAVSIEHDPITSARAGEPLRLRARIHTQEGRTAFEPTVFVRVSGLSSFTRVALKAVPGSDGLYEAEVPASLIAGDFDYYLESFDSEGDGPGRVGTPEMPLRVLIAAAAPAPVQTDKPVAANLAPRPAPAAPVIVRTESPALRARSQLPTFALFAAAGVSVGLAAIAMFGHQSIKGDLKSSSSSQQETNLQGSEYKLGNTLGAVSVGSFVAGGVFLISGIVYEAWPYATSTGGNQP